MTDYIELRCRSAFSFLAGASLPEELIERAAALGYPTLTLGDRDGVYGAPRFHAAAKKVAVRALIGAEIQVARLLGCYVVRGRRSDSEPNNQQPNNLTTRSLYLLVANRTGYQNLCRLITTAKLRAPKGQAVMTWDDLEGHTDGLICLLRDASLTTNNLTTNHLSHLFPNRLYIELQRHLDPAEERLNQALIAMAEHRRLPLVATNDVRVATASGKPLLDVLTCIRNGTTLDAVGRGLLRNAERHLKSSAEMVALFRDRPAAVANTRRVAEQCEFTLAALG